MHALQVLSQKPLCLAKMVFGMTSYSAESPQTAMRHHTIALVEEQLVRQ